jgi:prepilin-type processing-associated H-X9-DG protein
MLDQIPLRRGMTQFTNFNSLGWTADIHPNGGNVLFGDWHVQWLDRNSTSNALQNSGIETYRLVLP